ncbi:MAG: hypothetical protein KBT68_11185 [bacterium]|nr:hypothetical protein [Candidatus Colisoma equi]
MNGRGVVIEFDFAAMNGAELLFRTAKKFLMDLDGIPLDEPLEARYLAGRTYLDGLARLFVQSKTKKTAQKASRDFASAFADAVTAAVPRAIGISFRNFVKALADAGFAVAIATRADPDVARSAFESVLGENVILYREESDGYGFPTWESWRRACMALEMKHALVRAVAGSGFGVKTALVAGMKSIAVINDRIAYQDFGGAHEVVDGLSGKSAKKFLARFSV